MVLKCFIVHEFWEMWFLWLAKSRHKIFRAHFWFETKIKTSYETVLCTITHEFLTWLKNESLSSQFQFWVQGKNESNFPDIFFKLFINFLVDITYFPTYKKLWTALFSFWQVITDFWLLTWSKIKKFDFFCKRQFKYRTDANNNHGYYCF